jgi:hypothetical protein
MYPITKNLERLHKLARTDPLVHATMKLYYEDPVPLEDVLTALVEMLAKKCNALENEVISESFSSNNCFNFEKK